MLQISVAIWIYRPSSFYEINFLKTVRFSVEGKERIKGRFLNHPNLVIWEAEQIVQLDLFSRDITTPSDSLASRVPH